MLIKNLPQISIPTSYLLHPVSCILHPASCILYPVPEGVDMGNMESVTGKENVIAVPEASINHLLEAVRQMPETKLDKKTELYGRTVNGRILLI